MDLNTIVEGGSLLGLVFLGGLLLLAHQRQRKHLNELRAVNDRVHRLSALVKALSAQKSQLALRAKDKVDKMSLQLVIDGTADSLTTALNSSEVKSVARMRGRRIVR